MECDICGYKASGIIRCECGEPAKKGEMLIARNEIEELQRIVIGYKDELASLKQWKEEVMKAMEILWDFSPKNTLSRLSLSARFQKGEDGYKELEEEKWITSFLASNKPQDE